MQDNNTIKNRILNKDFAFLKNFAKQLNKESVRLSDKKIINCIS